MPTTAQRSHEGKYEPNAYIEGALVLVQPASTIAINHVVTIRGMIKTFLMASLLWCALFLFVGGIDNDRRHCIILWPRWAPVYAKFLPNLTRARVPSNKFARSDY